MNVSDSAALQAHGAQMAALRNFKSSRAGFFAGDVETPAPPQEPEFYSPPSFLLEDEDGGGDLPPISSSALGYEEVREPRFIYNTKADSSAVGDEEDDRPTRSTNVDGPFSPAFEDVLPPDDEIEHTTSFEDIMSVIEGGVSQTASSYGEDDEYQERSASLFLHRPAWVEEDMVEDDSVGSIGGGSSSMTSNPSSRRTLLGETESSSSIADRIRLFIRQRCHQEERASTTRTTASRQHPNHPLPFLSHEAGSTPTPSLPSEQVAAAVSAEAVLGATDDHRAGPSKISSTSSCSSTSSRSSSKTSTYTITSSGSASFHESQNVVDSLGGATSTSTSPTPALHKAMFHRSNKAKQGSEELFSGSFSAGDVEQKSSPAEVQHEAVGDQVQAQLQTSKISPTSSGNHAMQQLQLHLQTTKTASPPHSTRNVGSPTQHTRMQVLKVRPPSGSTTTTGARLTTSAATTTSAARGRLRAEHQDVLGDSPFSRTAKLKGSLYSDVARSAGAAGGSTSSRTSRGKRSLSRAQREKEKTSQRTVHDPRNNSQSQALVADGSISASSSKSSTTSTSSASIVVASTSSLVAEDTTTTHDHEVAQEQITADLAKHDVEVEEVFDRLEVDEKPVELNSSSSESVAMPEGHEEEHQDDGFQGNKFLVGENEVDGQVTYQNVISQALDLDHFSPDDTTPITKNRNGATSFGVPLEEPEPMPPRRKNSLGSNTSSGSRARVPSSSVPRNRKGNTTSSTAGSFSPAPRPRKSDIKQWCSVARPAGEEKSASTSSISTTPTVDPCSSSSSASGSTSSASSTSSKRMSSIGRSTTSSSTTGAASNISASRRQGQLSSTPSRSSTPPVPGGGKGNPPSSSPRSPPAASPSRTTPSSGSGQHLRVGGTKKPPLPVTRGTPKSSPKSSPPPKSSPKSSPPVPSPEKQAATDSASATEPMLAQDSTPSSKKTSSKTSGTSGRAMARMSPRASPSASPRASPRASPKASPEASPRASPRASPKASPRASPRASPKTAPKRSPKKSPRTSPKTFIASPRRKAPSAGSGLSAKVNRARGDIEGDPSSPSKRNYPGSILAAAASGATNITTKGEAKRQAEETPPSAVAPSAATSTSIVAEKPRSAAFSPPSSKKPQYIRAGQQDDRDRQERKKREGAAPLRTRTGTAQQACSPSSPAVLSPGVTGVAPPLPPPALAGSPLSSSLAAPCPTLGMSNDEVISSAVAESGITTSTTSTDISTSVVEETSSDRKSCPRGARKEDDTSSVEVEVAGALSSSKEGAVETETHLLEQKPQEISASSTLLSSSSRNTTSSSNSMLAPLTSEAAQAAPSSTSTSASLFKNATINSILPSTNAIGLVPLQLRPLSLVLGSGSTGTGSSTSSSSSQLQGGPQESDVSPRKGRKFGPKDPNALYAIAPCGSTATGGLVFSGSSASSSMQQKQNTTGGLIPYSVASAAAAAAGLLPSESGKGDDEQNSAGNGELHLQAETPPSSGNSTTTITRGVPTIPLENTTLYKLMKEHAETPQVDRYRVPIAPSKRMPGRQLRFTGKYQRSVSFTVTDADTAEVVLTLDRFEPMDAAERSRFHHWLRAPVRDPGWEISRTKNMNGRKEQITPIEDILKNEEAYICEEGKKALDERRAERRNFYLAMKVGGARCPLPPLREEAEPASRKPSGGTKVGAGRGTGSKIKEDEEEDVEVEGKSK
ncbi:unnamed protein product [Amoebophrya sp. A25]|nr:unnamed protein product [Amoebophrya sp. A25]|eukprot:GSA25T00004760001.1